MLHTRHLLLQYVFQKNDPLVNIATQWVFTLVYKECKDGHISSCKEWEDSHVSNTKSHMTTMWYSYPAVILAVRTCMACHSATWQPQQPVFPHLFVCLQPYGMWPCMHFLWPHMCCCITMS